MTILWSLLACSTSPVDSDPVDTDSSTPLPTPSIDGPCLADEDLGGFTVFSDDNGSVISGAVLDGVIPISVRIPIGSSDECTLLQQQILFCDPPCQAGSTCGFDENCVPFPTEQDLGAVHVRGLSADLVMEANSPGFSYFDLDLDHPPYAPGAPIHVGTTGGSLPALSWDGLGLEPLASSAHVLAVEEGRDLLVQWIASSSPGSQIRFRMSIDQHGNSPVRLDCSFDDDGEAMIDADLLRQLIDSGVTGRPSATLDRRTVDSAAFPGGCAELEVVWSTSREVDVVGFTPCFTLEDCPPDQICNTTLEICE